MNVRRFAPPVRRSEREQVSDEGRVRVDLDAIEGSIRARTRLVTLARITSTRWTSVRDEPATTRSGAQRRGTPAKVAALIRAALTPPNGAGSHDRRGVPRRPAGGKSGGGGQALARRPDDEVRRQARLTIART